jgi:putative ABC transport system permease protein
MTDIVRDAPRPDWIPHIRARLSRLEMSPTREAELIDELAQHLDARYEELLTSGHEPEEARRQTLAGFDVEGEFTRRMRDLRQARGPRTSLPAIALDLRHALRGLRHDWKFTLVAVVTLALGIGANSAIFSAVHTVVFQPLPFPDAERIVHLWLSRPHRPNWHFRVPPADFQALQADTRAFERLALYDTDTADLIGGARAEEIVTATVSASFFDLIGVGPALGRSFDAGDEAGARNVIIGDRLWRRRFGGDRSVLGSTLTIDDRIHRVVGIMPPDFAFPSDADVWLPRDSTNAPSNAYVLAKLKPAVSLAQAQTDLNAAVSAMTNGRGAQTMSLTAEPLKRSLIGNEAASWVLLLGAVSCVFAISCVNVANLAVARGLRRRRELDVRHALGASRWRIVGLLAIESLLLALSAGVAAAAMAWWAIGFLRSWAPGNTPRIDELGAQPALLWLALLASTVTAFAIGLIPAARLSRSGIDRSLRAIGAAGDLSLGRTRLANALIAVEIALALVLTIGAVVLARSLARLTTVDPGFRVEQLLTVTLHLRDARYPHVAQQLDFLSRTLTEVRALSGVTSASVGSGSVLTGLGLVSAQRTLAQRLSWEGAAADAPPREANLRRVDAQYFHTLGMHVVHGRTFAGTDVAGGPAVAIVNRTMARTLWGTEQVAGKRLSFQRIDGQPVWLHIVGVVNDTRDIALTEAPQPAFFVPLAQTTQSIEADAVTLFIRTSGAPLGFADAVRSRIGDINPAQPIAEVSTMEIAIDRYMAAPRFRTALLTGLALLGVLVALTGVYGVIAYAVQQRIPEMAIRLALGAQPRQIVGLVLAHGARLAIVGIGLGLAGSVVSSRFVRAVLFDIEPLDPATLTTVPIALALTVLLACYLPARRAAATDPVRALRGELEP